MFVFGLHSTSDDQPSDLSNECRLKCKKMKKSPLSHQKVKCSFLAYVHLWITFDDWLSDLSDERQLKHKKMKKGPLSHQKIKCSFLDNVQLLMIG